MYTFEVTTENGQPIARVSHDGAIVIRQDFNHKNNVPFASESDASAWATEYCAEMNDADARAKEAQKQAELLNQAQLVSALSQAEALVASDPIKYASLSEFVSSAISELSKNSQ